MKFAKRLLAVGLAATMCISMTAFAETADTEAAAESTFTWNGQKEVWAILPTTGVPALKAHADSCGAVLEELGFTYAAKDAEGNPGTQVDFVDQAIAAGNVGCLMIAAMDTELLKDSVTRAAEAGIAVCYLGAAPDYEIAGYIATAYEITGMYAVEAAEYWVQNTDAEIPTNADGKYEVAVDDYYGITDGVYRSNAIVGELEKSETLTMVSETQAYGNSATTDAMNNAQSVLNANPDCHIFICYEPDEAVGINSAIIDYCDQTGADLASYCVIPCYSADETFQELLAAAKEDPTANAIKGYATYGSDLYTDEAGNTVSPTGEKLGAILAGVCGLGDYTWTYGEPYYDDISAFTVNGFEIHWQQGDENPAEEYRHN